MDIASEADFHLLTDEELREFIASLDVPRARVQSFLAPKLDPQVVHAATRELLIEQLPRLIPKLADTRDAAQTDDEDEDVAQEAGETRGEHEMHVFWAALSNAWLRRCFATPDAPGAAAALAGCAAVVSALLDAKWLEPDARLYAPETSAEEDIVANMPPLADVAAAVMLLADALDAADLLVSRLQPGTETEGGNSTDGTSAATTEGAAGMDASAARFVADVWQAAADAAGGVKVGEAWDAVLLSNVTAVAQGVQQLAQRVQEAGKSSGKKRSAGAAGLSASGGGAAEAAEAKQQQGKGQESKQQGGTQGDVNASKRVKINAS